MVRDTLSFIAMVYMNTLWDERAKRAIFPYLGTQLCVCDCVTMIATKQLSSLNETLHQGSNHTKWKLVNPCKIIAISRMYCQWIFTFILLRKNKTNTKKWCCCYISTYLLFTWQILFLLLNSKVAINSEQQCVNRELNLDSNILHNMY